MARKSSASSQRGKLIRASAESIWNKPLTERQKAALDGVARRQKRADVSQLDYSDIPPLADKQLTQFRRPPKKLVAVRLDADVFQWLQQYGAGYSTRINNVLRVVMAQVR
ncbi:MAG: BrnA antitoxin family protein [Candidatus Solibacter sp.]|nr:BrnA antitoxin family protein [Candidatus Solibacter sp.]